VAPALYENAAGTGCRYSCSWTAGCRLMDSETRLRAGSGPHDDAIQCYKWRVGRNA